MQTHGHSALKIGGHKQRQTGLFLQTVEQFGGLVWFATIEKRWLPAHRHGECADVIFVHAVQQLEIGAAIGIQEVRPHPDHENLADFLFQRELAQCLFRPFPAVAVKMNGTRVLIFFFGQAGPAGSQEK